MAGAEAFTMYVLAKFAERYDARSYGSLVRRALGRKTAAGLSAVLLIYLWGSCVAYLVRKDTQALHNAARPSLLANSLDDPALACCSAAMCGGDPLRCRCSCLLLLVLHAAAHCCLHSALLMLFAFCSGKKWHV